jgi:hypothetical protein
VKARGTSTVNAARRRMLRVADMLDAAVRELGTIRRQLELAPKTKQQRRALKAAKRSKSWVEGEGMGLEAWIADGIQSTLEDADLRDAARLLRGDALAGGAEQELATWQAELRAEAAARRRAA